MTPEERKAARERCEKATPGPWTVEDEYDAWDVSADAPCRKGRADHLDHIYPAQDCDSADDAHFIAHAREALPKALDEIDRLEAENARLREALRLAEEAETHFPACRKCGADLRGGVWFCAEANRLHAAAREARRKALGEGEAT